MSYLRQKELTIGCSGLVFPREDYKIDSATVIINKHHKLHTIMKTTKTNKQTHDT